MLPTGTPTAFPECVGEPSLEQDLHKLTFLTSLGIHLLGLLPHIPQEELS